MTYKEKQQLVERANEAIKTVKGVECYICSYMDMSTITISPEHVEMKPQLRILVGHDPVRRDYKSTEEFKAARAEWKARAMPIAEAAFKEACSLLRKAKIRYRTGRYYSWPIARLA